MARKTKNGGMERQRNVRKRQTARIAHEGKQKKEEEGKIER